MNTTAGIYGILKGASGLGPESAPRTIAELGARIIPRRYWAWDSLSLRALIGCRPL